jgi:hypothetical protein
MTARVSDKPTEAEPLTLKAFMRLFVRLYIPVASVQHISKICLPSVCRKRDREMLLLEGLASSILQQEAVSSSKLEIHLHSDWHHTAPDVLTDIRLDDCLTGRPIINTATSSYVGSDRQRYPGGVVSQSKTDREFAALVHRRSL